MYVAFLYDCYLAARIFEVEAGGGVHAQGRELHPADVFIVLVAVDKSDKMLFLHRMHGLADPDRSINAGRLRDKTALFVDRGCGDVFYLCLGAFFF